MQTLSGCVQQAACVDACRGLLCVPRIPCRCMPPYSTRLSGPSIPLPVSAGGKLEHAERLALCPTQPVSMHAFVIYAAERRDVVWCASKEVAQYELRITEVQMRNALANLPCDPINNCSFNATALIRFRALAHRACPQTPSRQPPACYAHVAVSSRVICGATPSTNAP